MPHSCGDSPYPGSNSQCSWETTSCADAHIATLLRSPNHKKPRKQFIPFLHHIVHCKTTTMSLLHLLQSYTGHTVPKMLLGGPHFSVPPHCSLLDWCSTPHPGHQLGLRQHRDEQDCPWAVTDTYNMPISAAQGDGHLQHKGLVGDYDIPKPSPLLLHPSSHWIAEPRVAFTLLNSTTSFLRPFLQFAKILSNSSPVLQSPWSFSQSGMTCKFHKHVTASPIPPPKARDECPPQDSPG